MIYIQRYKVHYYIGRLYIYCEYINLDSLCSGYYRKVSIEDIYERGWSRLYRKPFLWMPARFWRLHLIFSKLRGDGVFLYIYSVWNCEPEIPWPQRDRDTRSITSYWIEPLFKIIFSWLLLSLLLVFFILFWAMEANPLNSTSDEVVLVLYIVWWIVLFFFASDKLDKNSRVRKQSLIDLR